MRLAAFELVDSPASAQTFERRNKGLSVRDRGGGDGIARDILYVESTDYGAQLCLVACCISPQSRWMMSPLGAAAGLICRGTNSSPVVSC